MNLFLIMKMRSASESSRNIILTIMIYATLFIVAETIKLIYINI